MINRKPMFDLIRRLLGRGFTQVEIAQIDHAFDIGCGTSVTAERKVQVGLTDQDFKAAAALLLGTVAQIRAVWEVECSGKGWFTDVRGDILNLDGPGGFIDGVNLPKILFEAHKFAVYTRGKYNQSHPNLSSPKWNKKLYVGGVGEWERLHRAMQLDEVAALKSASVGSPQIMGFNYELAGFPNVHAFWAAMKESESNQLLAFVHFIGNSGLSDEFRQISNVHMDCAPFAEGYNGSGYAANNYHINIAKAHKKWST